MRAQRGGGERPERSRTRSDAREQKAGDDARATQSERSEGGGEKRRRGASKVQGVISSSRDDRRGRKLF
jgi:hypothetical protein